MHAALLAPLALLPLLPFQDGQDGAAPPQAGAREQPRVTFAGVAVVVNDSIVTLDALDREMRRRLELTPLSTDPERIELRNDVVREAIRRELRIQAGADMGVEQQIIKSQVDNFYKEKQEELGVLGASKFLSEQAGSVAAARTEATNTLYKELWEQSNLGIAPGKLGRRYRDRYIRPGELYGIYEREKKLLPDEVELQYLVVLAVAAGGTEAARELCAECRDEVVAGRELAELVAEYGAAMRQTGGIAPAAPINALPSPELREWLERAPVGGLSPVVPYVPPERPDEVEGYQIVRLLGRREPPEPPPFVDADLQQRLLTQVRQYRDRQAIDRADVELQANAYIWTFLDRARQ